MSDFIGLLGSVLGWPEETTMPPEYKMTDGQIACLARNLAEDVDLRDPGMRAGKEIGIHGLYGSQTPKEIVGDPGYFDLVRLSGIEPRSQTEAVDAGALWKKVLGIDSDARKDDTYSGRGMSGKTSLLAFSTGYGARDPEGEKFKKLGFTWDQLGRGYIWYLTATKPEAKPAGEAREPRGGTLVEGGVNWNMWDSLKEQMDDLQQDGLSKSEEKTLTEQEVRQLTSLFGVTKDALAGVSKVFSAAKSRGKKTESRRTSAPVEETDREVPFGYYRFRVLEAVASMVIAGSPAWMVEKVDTEPVQRALDRMADAKDRGGVDGMIKDTETRIKATKDAGKLLGIATAIEKFIVSDEVGITPEQVKALRALQAQVQVPQRKRVADSGTVSKDRVRWIRSAGSINPVTGENNYWDDGTNEVWKDSDGKLKVVHTSGKKPAGIGSTGRFMSDQTQKLLWAGTMVGWFSTDPKGEMAGEVPLKSLLISTYK